jgi:lipopolysaccharide transport system ATP-binding protein
MSTPAITTEKLGKRYFIGSQRSKKDGLRHSVESALRAPLTWLRSQNGGETRTKEFWALQDLSFQINQGEVVGIIGSNGAGKSTLLKLLSRITVPTTGRIRIEGRVASLLEVGTGFHQELTGRENIFLNGAILGMTRAEIIRKFDEIVAFSEIEKFLDTPVKRYSSGMYVRLAFAVAAHLEPEILIVDEVLAVGDVAFQRKCLGKMGSFAQSGKTVLFVSHNMEALRNLCQRGLWLKNGRLEGDGPADEIVSAYSQSTTTHFAFTPLIPDFGLSIQKVVLKNDHDMETGVFKPGDDLFIEVHYEASKHIERPYLALGVECVVGHCFAANMRLDGHRPDFLFGPGKVTCRFKAIPLLPQKYTVKIIVWTGNGTDVVFDYQDAGYFEVAADLAPYGYAGDFRTRTSRVTPTVVPYQWQLPDGKCADVSLVKPTTA